MNYPQSALAPRTKLPDDFMPFEKSELEQSIPHRFEKMVVNYPDRLAVKTRWHAFTYAQLNATANRIAHAVLDRCGMGSEPVALLFEHGAPFIPALLGVLKAGKFYVPTDPALPYARLADLLSDLQTRLILTNNANLAMARALVSDAIQVINIDALGAQFPTENPALSISPKDFAYLIYTSGSTGKPKGVLIDHRNVLHYTMNYTNSVHYSKEDRISWLNALNSNPAGSDIYPALLNGAALFPFFVKEEGMERLAAWLHQEEITSYGSVPVIFRLFASTLVGAELFPKLRLIRLGGDRLLRSDVELFKKHFSARCLLRNGLGAAEVLLIRQYFIDKQTEVTTHVLPVGYALEDTEVLILDDNRQPLGCNQVGEIAVKSRYMSPGYWRQPDLTAARFLVMPDGSDERIYLTGDLGRMQPDGCLIHLGRKDFQVKIRGKLIAPMEVENALLDLQAIKEAVVVAREDRTGEPRLVAYFVPVQQPGPTVSAIRQALAEKLAPEMIPSAFVALDTMPLTTNNKIDRLALPALALTRPALDTPFVAARTPIEKMLSTIWSAVLHLEEISIHDNFLELGGTRCGPRR